jgi:glycerol-3-phosphate acyltransferase PlsY
MLTWLTWLGAIGAAYLLGSIPSGLLVGRLIFGVDVREHGSHRTGATNVLRTLGTKAAVAVFAMDLAKGLLAVLLARWLLPGEPWAHMLAAFAAAAGHNWPIFVGFRGGRGVIVSLAALCVMHIPVAALVLLTGFVVIWRTRYVSLGSMCGAIVAPLSSLAFYLHGDLPLPYLVYAIIGGALVVITHKDNIRRLLAGTESRIGQRVSAA